MNLCWKIKCGIVLVLLVAVAGLRAEPLASGTNQLQTRLFKLGADRFGPALAGPTGTNALPSRQRTEEMYISIRDYFSAQGMELRPPGFFYYNDQLGRLFVGCETNFRKPPAPAK